MGTGIRCIVLILLTTGAILAACGGSDSETVTVTTGPPAGCHIGGDFTPVTNRMQAAVDAAELPGIGLVVVDRCGTLYQQAVGRELDAESLIASATKLTSATVMMSLVDEGLIALDDRIDDYLPYFPSHTGAITLRQLLSQTHGLPFSNSCIPAPGEQSAFLTLDSCVRKIAQDVQPEDMTHTPGTVCDYSPAVSYQIMGRMAEVVTDQSWETLWRERVGTPLAMTHSTFVELENPRVGGGLSTSLEDYAHLVQMYLRDGEWSGTRVLSEWAVAEMQIDSCAGLPFDSDVDKAEIGYGLTWWIDENDVNGTPIQLSVAGAFGAIPWINHTHDYAAFWLTDDDLAQSALVWEDVLPLIHAALYTPP